MIENPTEEQLKTIWGIIYLITNTINGKNYVGKTYRTFAKRYPKLEWWNKTNQLLSRAAKKYGTNNFTISILLNGITNRKELSKLEDFYAIKYNAYYPSGYNLLDCKKPSRRLCSYTSKYKGVQLKNKNGKIATVNNITVFCNKHDLEPAAFYRMLKGQIDHVKNWTLINNPDSVFESKFAKTIQLKSPEGDTVTIKNLTKFAKLNNLKYDRLSEVYYGRRDQYRGWTRINEIRTAEEIGMLDAGKFYFFMNQNSKIIKIRNLNKFCRENNYKRVLFQDLVRGKRKEVYGYRLPVDWILDILKECG
ncbi:MAG: hypothetical protein AABY22_01355 [Nanoarchaeota archaeon]